MTPPQDLCAVLHGRIRKPQKTALRLPWQFTVDAICKDLLGDPGRSWFFTSIRKFQSFEEAHEVAVLLHNFYSRCQMGLEGEFEDLFELASRAGLREDAFLLKRVFVGYGMHRVHGGAHYGNSNAVSNHHPCHKGCEWFPDVYLALHEREGL
jgi:hypothetical protein